MFVLIKTKIACSDQMTNRPRRRRQKKGETDLDEAQLINREVVTSTTAEKKEILRG